MKLIKLLFVTLITLSLIYIGGWYYLAHELNKGIDKFYNIDGPLLGYEFYGDKPTLSGFPYKPTLTYKKGLARDNIKIQFENLQITAIPLPNQPLDINIDRLSIQDDTTQKIYEIDEFQSTLIIPKYFPSDMTRPQLSAWQKEIGYIDFKSIYIDKNGMITKAQGPIGLDDNLQLTLNLDTQMTKYKNLIHFLTAETSELNLIQGTLLLSVLNGLAKTDETTGEKIVNFTISIKDRKVYIGPVLTIRIPFITWPERIGED